MTPQDKENQQLKRTLSLLISKAERNQEVLGTFQAIELQLLSCHRLSDLVTILLKDLLTYFSINTINLVLFDPEHIARDILEDYSPPQGSGSLLFVDNNNQLKALYPSLKKPVLRRASKELSAQAFPNNKHVRSFALLPLVRQGTLIGSLHLGSYDDQRYTEQLATDYISHMCSIISICIENCINQETLRRLSIIDMLTKVNNRRSFDRELLKELSRASRNREPLSCLFIDIDHFKLVNDRHGHQIGDRVLTTTAQAIKQLLRKTDLIARYGGEEFAVLLPACDEQRASQIAETIRKSVSDLPQQSEEGDCFAISLSIGISTCTPDSHNEADILGFAHQLVASADQGVYRAKETGRNQVAYVPIQAIKPQNRPDMDADISRHLGVNQELL